MENQRDSKTPKVYGRRRSGSTSSSGPHASGSSDSPSALSKNLRRDEPKLDSPTAFNTPVKAEEDVIVADKIPAPKSNKGGSEVWTNLTSNYSTYSGGRSSSTTLSSAGGGVIANSKPEKNTLCRFWTSFQTCRFGSRCKFVHVEEELRRPPPSSGEIKHEGPFWPSYGKSYSQVTQSSLPAAMALSTAPAQVKHLSGSAVPSSTVPEAKQSGTDGKSCSQITKSPSAAEEASSSPSLPAAMALSTALAQVKLLSGSAVPSSTVPEATQSGTDWSPLDDGIEINLPSAENPSKEDVNAHIGEVLSGTKSKKRLQVFEDICPE